MPDTTKSTKPDWEQRLSVLLPLFGHRNWIVVADSAYPAQSNPGIETIAAAAEQIDAVRAVRDAILASRHVRANMYVDAELGFVEETDAPGIADYKKQLDAVLYGSSVHRIPHEQIIQKLDQSAQLFRILIIKTEMTIPYTSVFFELDCGYWNAEAEERLREAMQASGAR
jgi:L-fucose mutarotase/ribose pyranase (RbsD/FucU family)